MKKANLKLPKVRIPKVVYKTILSIVVLLMVLVGGGVAYTWYVGNNDAYETPAGPEPAANPVEALTKPREIAPDAKFGASVQFITSPVEPGKNSSISIKTRPEAECEIVVEYDEVKSEDSGLVPKKADEYGIVGWTWTVEDYQPVGKWPVEVTCAYGEQSAFVRSELRVEHKD
jgi:hypothetical protein